MAGQSDEDKKPWMVRDVPERTRQRVKAYAADKGITIGQALVRIVTIALGTERAEPPGRQSTGRQAPQPEVPDWMKNPTPPGVWNPVPPGAFPSQPAAAYGGAQSPWADREDDQLPDHYRILRELADEKKDEKKDEDEGGES